MNNLVNPLSKKAFQAAVLFLPLLVVFLLTQGQAAYGEEVRVVDEAGLTRAVKQAAGSTDIIITFSDNQNLSGKDISIRDISGLQEQQKSRVDSRGTVQFSEVSSGTWQIFNLPEGAGIQSVRIVEKPQ